MTGQFILQNGSNYLSNFGKMQVFLFFTKFIENVQVIGIMGIANFVGVTRTVIFELARVYCLYC